MVPTQPWPPPTPDVFFGQTRTNPRGFYELGLPKEGMTVLRAHAVHGIVNLHVLAYTTRPKRGTVFWFPPRTVAQGRSGQWRKCGAVIGNA